MARRRRLLERPHDHLQHAAAAHARITGEAGQVDAELETEAEAARNEEQSQRARAQRRNDEGKFA